MNKRGYAVATWWGRRGTTRRWVLSEFASCAVSFSFEKKDADIVPEKFGEEKAKWATILKKIDDRILNIVQNNVHVSTDTLLGNLSPQGKDRKAGDTISGNINEMPYFVNSNDKFSHGTEKVRHLSSEYEDSHVPFKINEINRITYIGIYYAG